jgi:hypothetical protein
MQEKNKKGKVLAPPFLAFLSRFRPNIACIDYFVSMVYTTKS